MEVYGTSEDVVSLEAEKNLTKQEQREIAKARRFAISKYALEESSHRVCNNFIYWFLCESPYPDVKTILVYTSKYPEVDTTRLIEWLLENGFNVVVPIIQKADRTLRLSYVKNMSVLVPSTFNVPEPIGNEIPANPDDIQLAIIPMVAFDPQGNRIGYGAGYYDGFLVKHPDIPKVGFAFECQEFPHVEHDERDIKMDFVVTEEKMVICNGQTL